MKDETKPPLDHAAADRQDTGVIQALKERLDENLNDFHATLAGMDEAEIAESSEVASVRNIYSFLREDYEFTQHQAEALLRLDNPLKFLVDNYPCYDIVALVRDTLGDLPVEMGKDALAQSNQAAKDTTMTPKPSVMKQIKANRQTAKQQSAQKLQDKANKIKKKVPER